MKRSLFPRPLRMNPRQWIVRCLKPNGTVPKKGMMIFECQVCFARFKGRVDFPIPLCPSCGHPDLKAIGEENES